jgi:glycosyltransferase involved in cell wall biosynthesis
LLYEYEDEIDPKLYLEIPPSLNYEVIKIGKMPVNDKNRTFISKIIRLWNNYYGNPIKHARKSDIFLQFDSSLGVPKRPKTILVEHDIIPYIFWNDYFTSPWLHVKHKAARTTIRTIINNYGYKRVLQRSLRNAWKIICVSENTQKDVREYFHINLKKMEVVHLGASIEPLKSLNDTKVSATKKPTKPYLLFIGAVDARRRAVDDIIAAYNNLKAEGQDIQLALVGENFQSHTKILDKNIKKLVEESSYSDDILTLGYVSDDAKLELYKNAIAFVFPTLYEGFGIPILEAMLAECPVISYRNSSIPEVGGKYVLYASGWKGIWSQTINVVNMDTQIKLKLIRRAKKHALEYKWENISNAINDLMVKS